MPRKPKNQRVCDFFTWVLFQRGCTWYADGRGNSPSVGKHSLAVTDRAQAIEELRKLDRRMAAKHKLIEPLPENQEVSIGRGWDAFDKYVARPDVLGGAGPKTRARYRAVRQKHESFCGGRGIHSWNQVGKKEILAYGAHLKSLDYGDATVYLELTVLKQVLKFLIEEEQKLPESARVRLKLRRSQQSATFCPNREQLMAMVKFCQGTPQLHWMADVIIALCTTGMRIGELCALRWSDVDLVTNIVTLPDNRHSGRHQQQGAVRTTKGRRSRRVPIHPKFRACLDALPRNPDGRVLHGPLGRRLKPDTVLSTLKRELVEPLKTKFPTAKDEIGFVHCRVHSFRHFFVSQACVGGASEGEIREWVGHTDSRIVERYRHLSSDDAKRKMDKIEFFNGDAVHQVNAVNGDGHDAKNNDRGGAEQNNAGGNSPPAN